MSAELGAVMVRRRMKKRLLLLWIGVLLLALGTALVACGDDDEDEGGGGGGGGASAEIDTLKPGTLIVGVDVPVSAVGAGTPPGLRGLRDRARRQDRGRARARAGVQGHGLRHDLPRPRAGQVRPRHRRLDHPPRAREGGRLLRSLLPERAVPPGDARTATSARSRTWPARRSVPRRGPRGRPTPRRTPRPGSCATTPRSTTRSTRSSPDRSTA